VWWPITADQPTPQRTIDAHAGWIRAIAISPDGQLLATAGNDLKVKVWRFADGSLVKEFTGHERHVYHVVFHPDGKQLLSGDLVAKFFHWSLDADAPVRQFAIASLSKFDAGFMADYGGPHCMTITPDGKRVLAGGITNVTNAFAGIGNPIIVQIDWDAGKDAVTHLTKGKINGVVWGVAMHPEGFVIGALGGQAGGQLYFWKPDQADEFHTFNLGNSARDLSLHPDGLRLATAHHDGNVRISLMAPKPA
jgi:WD40 repeat protein